MIPFTTHGNLTLGVEIELQLIDKNTRDFKHVAIDLLSRVKHNPKIKPEFFQSMIEINTGVCCNVQEAEADLQASIAQVKEVSQELGAVVAGVGTHPFARYAERMPYPSERYDSLIDRNQWIARRMIIFGLHVHIGMPDGDSCVHFNNFFLWLVPHMLGLSASSPFWQSDETGLASCRATIFESCPTAGHPPRFKNWEEFSSLCDRLIRCHAIQQIKDLWWDLRPSPDYGTLEIRACDGTATLAETMAMVAFIHALAHWYRDHKEFDVDKLAPYSWIIRENKWRAVRHGLDAEIIIDGEGRNVPLREDVQYWIGELSPYIKALGYEKYFDTLQNIMRQGASYQRQRAIFARTGSLQDVVLHNVKEFDAGYPLWD